MTTRQSISITVVLFLLAAVFAGCSASPRGKVSAAEKESINEKMAFIRSQKWITPTYLGELRKASAESFDQAGQMMGMSMEDPNWQKYRELFLAKYTANLEQFSVWSMAKFFTMEQLRNMVDGKFNPVASIEFAAFQAQESSRLGTVLGVETRQQLGWPTDPAMVKEYTRMNTAYGPWIID